MKKLRAVVNMQDDQRRTDCSNHFCARRKRFLSVYVIMMSIAMVFTGLSGNALGQTGSVSGVVIDSATGHPLERARVSIPEAGSAVSDEYGVFKIKNVPIGEYTLLAEMLGYDPGSLQVSVESNNQSVGEFELVGRFTDGDRLFVEGRRRA